MHLLALVEQKVVDLLGSSEVHLLALVEQKVVDLLGSSEVHLLAWVEQKVVGLQEPSEGYLLALVVHLKSLEPATALDRDSSERRRVAFPLEVREALLMEEIGAGLLLAEA